MTNQHTKDRLLRRMLHQINKHSQKEEIINIMMAQVADDTNLCSKSLIFS